MRRAACLLALALAACGGSTPTTPSETPRSSSSITPGRYTFVVSMGSNGQEGLQPPCLIAGTGNPLGSIPMPVTAFIVIAVSDGAGGLRLQPEATYDRGWTMTLLQSGDAVEGTIRGTAQDMLYPQTVTVDGGGAVPDAARITGSFGFNHNFVGGHVGGRVVFASGGWTYSCPNNDWILNRIGQ